MLIVEESLPACRITTAAAYGSRPSPGRRTTEPLQRLIVIAVAVALGRGDVAILIIVVFGRGRLRLLWLVIVLLRRFAPITVSAHSVPFRRIDRLSVAGMVHSPQSDRLWDILALAERFFLSKLPANSLALFADIASNGIIT